PDEPRFQVPPGLRLDGCLDPPGAGVQRQEAARPDGQAAGDRPGPASPAGRPGAQPAAGRRVRAGGARLLRAGALDHRSAQESSDGRGMPKLPVFDLEGERVDEIELSDAVFAAPVNRGLLHQAVVMYEANRRVGTAAAKTRGMVAGGG